MTEDSLLTMKEIEVLEDLDNELTHEEISARHDISKDDIKGFIEKARVKRENLRMLSEDSTEKADLRGIEELIGVEQTGIIKVGSQIIKYLSEGIYSSPANSLKEIVNNAYDADATEVSIQLTSKKIEILDNGNGMDWRTFEEDFTFIGISIKRKEDQYTKTFNRPIIGFLGIGFISVFELCNKLLITSCKKNSKILFKAEIDFSRYRNIELEEKEFYEISEYKLVNYEKETFDVDYEDSFTKIELTDLLPGFKDMILDKSPFGDKKITIRSIMNHVVKTQKYGLTNLGSFWQILIELSMITPINYLKEGIYKNKKDKILQKIVNDVKKLNFKVTVNGIELYKPFLFPFTKIRNEVHTFDEKYKTPSGTLSYYGYFYSQHGMINPREFIGLLIRVDNIAIGSIDRSVMQYPSGTNQLFRNWVFGEIYVKEGFRDALNINRNQLKITNENYILFRSKMHEMLNDIIFKNILNNFYRVARDERYKEREEINQSNIMDIINKEYDGKYSVLWKEMPTNEIVIYNKNNNEIIINPSSSISMKLPIKDQYLFEKIMLLLEISINKSKGDVIILKKVFIEKLEKWLD